MQSRLAFSLATCITRWYRQTLAGDKASFDFPSFLEILAAVPSAADAKQDVLKAFKAYDTGNTGSIKQGVCST